MDGAQTYCGPQSVEVEGDVDDDLHGDGMALEHGGPELILAHGFNGSFVESHAQAADDANVLGIALLIDDELDGSAALEVGLAGFLSELGLGQAEDTQVR